MKDFNSEIVTELKKAGEADGFFITITRKEGKKLFHYQSHVNFLPMDLIPSLDEIKKIWSKFKSVPQELELPFAPKQPIIYIEEDNRPQPVKDRDVDKAMAVVIGRLRPCKVFDIRFVGLSHNTVRGAAGGGILNAELLYAKEYLK